ncbi:MAG: TldD/PmbA family protein [Candidatus Delongbacteria bacterium]|nr:TldD/PmbA family protein [Candidatus Delongbacteria bacterium]MCG2760384.1 TldD/PmbA family protein [Candidatus Delongbacteria bacterium]
MNEGIKKKIIENIDKLLAKKAEYVDVRLVTEDNSESIVLYDGNLEGNDTTFENGIGIRTLFDGAWGFAATSNLSKLDECFDLSFLNAKSAAKLVNVPLKMGKKKGHTGSYKSPVKKDPFRVNLKDKIDFLKEIDKNLQEEWIFKRYISANMQKKNQIFFNSEGTIIDRQLTDIFATMMVMGIDNDGEMQRRSHELFSYGNGTRGWEMLTKPDLFSSHSGRIKSELASLIKAESLKYGKKSVILLPGQGWLQVHETIGHPLELDRILGYELSYAGGSFVTLDSFGKLKYGNEKLNVSAYGGFANSPGSFGFDDEGSPERDYLLIDKGILVNALTSRAMIREANEKAGRKVFSESGGAARSTAFYRAPIDRMTNVNILPGKDGTLENIISNTEDGIIVDNPTSWSIGSNREHFHFGCEIAWEVKKGKKTKILRNPTYQGHTVEFYNSLAAVGDKSTWRVGQVDNCGKGEPNQAMELGHGVPVIKFDNVITGERK